MPNFNYMTPPVGFDVVDVDLLRHRYSSYSITPDMERGGGWAVVQNVRSVIFDDETTVAFDVVTYHDRMEDACHFVEVLTNRNVQWAD